MAAEASGVSGCYHSWYIWPDRQPGDPIVFCKKCNEKEWFKIKTDSF